MCTALTLDAPKHLFGRNLDLAASFGQLAICLPKDAPIQFFRKKAASHYAMLGIGAKLGDLPLFAEAINSEGLAMAGLNFPGNAYFKAPDGRTNEVGQGELIAYVLCFCKDLGEAKELISSISLCDIRVEPNTHQQPGISVHAALHGHVPEPYLLFAGEPLLPSTGLEELRPWNGGDRPARR